MKASADLVSNSAVLKAVPFDLAVVEVHGGAAEIDVVAGARRAAVDPQQGPAHLEGVDVVQQPAADQRVAQARVEVQGLALADGQFVGDGGDVALRVIDRRNALFRDRIGIVEPGHLLHQPRINVIEYEREAMGSAFLEADVDALEIGAAVVEVLLEHAA